MINNPKTNQSASDARSVILTSIREHLAESVCHDLSSGEVRDVRNDEGHKISSSHFSDVGYRENLSPLEQFGERLESVGGRCFIARDQAEAAQLLTSIIRELQTSQKLRVAFSDAPLVQTLIQDGTSEVSECVITPSADELFGFDVGITAAQAAIAETGTLVLESESERHRLVSLLPPVHIAIIKADDICLTLGDALRYVRRGGQSGMSRAITFITGPSRTADIELTLTIGVHGPKELS